MPSLLPLASDTLRFSFIQGSTARVCFPAVAAGSAPGLSLEPGESESNAGAFYYRYQLGKALVFSGADFAFLNGVNKSRDRCQPLGLLLETRPHAYAAFQHEAQFVFTCNECKDWDEDAGTVSVLPTTDDAYRVLLENWETEYNLLDIPDFGPTRRRQVTAELATLGSGITLEFKRIDANEQGDYVGQDGWSLFLTNTSFIAGTTGALGIPNPDSTRSRDIILFRYRLNSVPMRVVVNGRTTTYTADDKTDTGWQLLLGSENAGVSPHTVDYVKSPSIAGFQPYKIGTYNQWNDPQNPARTNRYGDQLLLLPCFESPFNYGLDNANYLKVTGTGGGGGGPSMGGAFNAEADGGLCLNVRRRVDQGDTEPSNSKSLWWRFGTFRFGRCFPLLDGLHFLLQQTGLPLTSGGGRTPLPAVTALLPPLPAQLSTFYTADPNPATGDSGAANEIPRLLLSAASDVKRYGASEAATRLLISLKTLLSDLSAFWDVGWFVDPATGWLRVEHRAYRDALRATGSVYDVTTEPEALLPVTYGYRTGQLPRYEELTITAATTEDLPRNVFFGKASIDYGLGGCVNGREGQNKTSRTSARLNGDVVAMVLSGDAVPDNALAVLAPGPDGQLPNANRELAASEVLRRYHTYGAGTYSASVAGAPLLVHSVRPGIEQAAQSVYRCTLRGLDATTRLTTRLGSEGEIGIATLDLQTGVVSLTPWLPVPNYTAAAPVLHARDFSDEFTPVFT